MPTLTHLDDLDPRGSGYGHPSLGQTFRALVPSLFESEPDLRLAFSTQALSNVKQVPASTANYTVGRLGYAIKGVIIHTSVGTMSACDGAFTNPARGASAHYAIPYNGYNDGPIHQYVAEGNIAWHCGRYYPDASHPLGNTNTIGIEHIDNGAYNNPRPDALYEATSQLVREICNRYHIPINRTYIRKHNEVSELPTGCPDSLDINRIVSMAAGAVPIPVITTGDDEDMLYVGPLHPKAATVKMFAAGHSYKERTTNSPPVTVYPAGASVAVSGYSYSSSPVQSPDLGGGVPGPDYVWWNVGGNWLPDAYLDTSGMTGAPTPAIPAAEPMDTLFATQAQVKAIPAGTPGPKGDKGDPGTNGTNGKDGAPGPVGTVPDHTHPISTTGTMVK